MHMMPLPRHASAHCAWNRPCGASLADQTLMRGESLVKFLSSSRFQHAKGVFNWVSDEWRHVVTFFGMLFRARRNNGRPAFAERFPIYVHTYFIRCPDAKYAI